MFVLCCIWFIVAFLWITITSALDKEWMIDGRGINNVCDVGNDSNLLIVFYVQIMPDDFVMQLHRF